jgi:hypothetical protein
LCVSCLPVDVRRRFGVLLGYSPLIEQYHDSKCCIVARLGCCLAAKGKWMYSNELSEIRQARQAFSVSLFGALASMQQYLSEWRLHRRSYSDLSTAALQLAAAAEEMDFRLRAVIQFQFPNADRACCDRFAFNAQQEPVREDLLNHVLGCSPCYERLSGIRATQRLSPIAHDLLWMLLLDEARAHSESQLCGGADAC